MASSAQTKDDNADSQSTERRLIAIDDNCSDKVSNDDISKDEWDDDEDANRRYDSGPGKLFQEQIAHGNVDHPQLKITNIPAGCGSPAVRRECEACGALESFKYVAGKREGAPAHAFVEFKTSSAAAKALDHLNSLPLGIRAKPTKTEEQKAKEEEERRQTCELLRSCGYKNVRDNPSDLCSLFCSRCGREEKNFEIRRCVGCLKAAYCSKACQTKDWPLHKLSCDRVLEKVKKKKRAEKDAAAERFDSAVFKSFPNAEEALTSSRDTLVSLTPPSPGIIWGVVDPELFGVIPEEDVPLDYQLLHSLIRDFAVDVSVFTIIENPRFGELVIAECQAEDVYARAVITEIRRDHRQETDSIKSPASSEKESASPNNETLFTPAAASSTESVPPADILVDLWFIDHGVFQPNTSIKDLIPVRDFWDELRRLEKRSLDSFLNAKHFIHLPARLIPCFLHATDPDTGESRRLFPSNFEDSYTATTTTTTACTSNWAIDAISSLKRFTSFSLDVTVKDKVNNNVGVSTMKKSESSERDPHPTPTVKSLQSVVSVGLMDHGLKVDFHPAEKRHLSGRRLPFPHWGVELTKDLGVDLFLDVGDFFLNEGWADFQDLTEWKEEEEEDYEIEAGKEELEDCEIASGILPKDVPQLPLEDGPVVITHFISPTHFYVVNQGSGAHELKRMMDPISRSVEGKMSFGLGNSKPRVGDLVLAFYQDLPYRAIVLALEDDHVKVNFVDWGNSEIVSLLHVYEASPEIASFMRPSSRCSVSPSELRMPGALDIANHILNSEQLSDRLEIRIVSGPQEDSRSLLLTSINGHSNDSVPQHSDSSSSSSSASPLSSIPSTPNHPAFVASPPPPPTYHVTLIDSLGRRLRDLAENLLRLPRLKDMKLRRDLFMKKFPCFIHSYGRSKDKRGGGGGVDGESKKTESSTTTASSSSPPAFEMVVVPNEESTKLKLLNEELLIFHDMAKPEEYFFPRKGQIVIGRDAAGVVMRYLLDKDVGYGDRFASVFSLDYGYRDSILASSLRRLPSDSSFAELPVQSLRCRLLNAPPPDSLESTALSKILEDPDAEIVCEIDRIVDRIYWIHLFVDGEKLVAA